MPHEDALAQPPRQRTPRRSRRASARPGAAREVLEPVGIDPLDRERLDVGERQRRLHHQPNGLQRVGDEAPDGDRVPDAEGEAGHPDHGRDAVERRATGADESVIPKPVVTIVIETAVNSARTTSATQATVVEGIAARMRTPTPALPPMPWTSPIPKAPSGSPHRVLVVLVLVDVGVQVEVAVAPADEQPEREEHDQRRDGGLGALLHALGQELLEEEDRQRRRATSVSAWPRPQNAPSRAAARLAFSSPDATSVVTAAMWSGSVACRSPRSAATRITTRPRRRSRDWRSRRRVRTWWVFACLSGSVQMTPGRALTVSATPTPRITSALSAGQRADDAPLERDAAEGATGEARRGGRCT